MIKVKVDISGLQKKFAASVKAINDGAIVGMQYALDGAENNVKKRIATSGTYGSANRFAGYYEPFAGPGISGIGRINTGRMYDSITRSIARNGKEIVGTLGWPDNRPKYFDLQEKGFNYQKNKYPISGASHHVEGMFAWRDAKTILNKTAPGLMASWVKEYVRRAAK